MIFIHDSELGCHGSLKSSNCLVDSRFVLQISDFGLYYMRAADIPLVMDEETYYSRKLTPNFSQMYPRFQLNSQNFMIDCTQ